MSDEANRGRENKQGGDFREWAMAQEFRHVWGRFQYALGGVAAADRPSIAKSDPDLVTGGAFKLVHRIWNVEIELHQTASVFRQVQYR